MYSTEELYAMAGQKSYPGTAVSAAFLLGGIGTGNVSIGSRGELRDWEIFNHPAKGSRLPNTYFAIWAKKASADPVAKVLESRLQPPHALSHGYHPVSGGGLPRMAQSSLCGEYPFAWVEFEDEDLPVSVKLEAFTPFIPLNPEDSGIPGAIFTYSVTNRSDEVVDVSIVGSLKNPIGGTDADVFGNPTMQPGAGHNVNDFVRDSGFSGLLLRTENYAASDLKFGNMALVTTNANVSYKRAWLRGAWYDELQEFWNDFITDGRLTDLDYDTPSEMGKSDTGSLAVHETLQPGESKDIRFILTWYFPNRINGWSEHIRIQSGPNQITQNHYVNRFDGAWSAAKYLVSDFDRLHGTSSLFHDALFSSTLPSYVLEAVASNITTLRSTTCFWLRDGRFLGYEGCFDHWGSCDGNCTHVWNYAQTLAFLFPTLEQNMRKTEFLEEVESDGKMNFRALKMFGARWEWQGESAPPAADGQMGTIMRVYREWKLTGDDAFLRDLWPSVQKALNYALPHWDTDGDDVFDGKQHNTYDIEFYGPNPLTAVFFLGALKAASEMASFLGDDAVARQYSDMFTRSAKRVDALLWAGDYYIQKLDDVNAYKYQHGLGCLSDQLLGQQLAHLYGLGYLLPPDHVRTAVKSVFDYNFRDSFINHHNLQRTYALNDEQGLLLCSWPHGGRPDFPFVYSDEVWTGIEYQVATHLIYEGLVDEGLTIVKAVRDRHDGLKRNPWNEVECGHHYARAMASWGLLVALGGYQCDMAQGIIRFDPVLNAKSFSTFWSSGRAWGTFAQTYDDEANEWQADIKVLYGDASGITVIACGKEWKL